MMHSLLEKKPWVLLLVVLALGALAVLSVGLGDVPFGDAQPIGRQEAEPPSQMSRLELRPMNEVSLSTQVTLWVALLFLVMLIGVLLSPEGRKRMLRLLMRTAFTVWALYLLFTRYPEVFDFLNPGTTGDAPRAQSLGLSASAPPPVFTPPQETPMLSYTVSLLVILGLIFVGWRVYRAWQAVNVRPAQSLQDLARIARASLRDLSSGRETTDVIMNCYFRMSDVVADKRHLQRGLGMTPAEFASRLEEAGLPGDAVQRLTRLFEAVRYGERRAGSKEVNEAVACLTTILQYCGEAV
jgi:hypothetical protein